MKDDRNLEQLLRQALSPEEEPNDWLNQKILGKAKEREMMNKTYHKKMPAAALAAAAVISVSSLTAVAAWKYLTPDKVAKEVEDQELAAAFQSEGAISINESQVYGNYKITLLGVVSGKNLSQYVSADDAGDVQDDRTYVVTAIENADGSPRPGTDDSSYGEDPFFVSPLIKGQDPTRFNVMTMCGGYTEFVQDGIQYRITETDNVEIFADRLLYLSVNSGSFYDRDAYQFDETTGEITRNEAYEGVNALFHLPLDEKKGDKEKADAYIRNLEKELEGTKDKSADEKEAERETGAIDQITEEIADWTQEDLEQKATLLEELTQTLKVDEKGYFSYSYQIGGDGMGSSGKILADSIFEENQTGMSNCMQVFGGDTGESVYIETFTRNEDGTIILKVYQCNEN